MMKMAAVLAIVSLVILTASRNIRGSLVVAIVSSKGNYVVVASESRNTNRAGLTPANDDACKIISVDGKTLFFETGESEYRSKRGDLWDARAVARAVYLKARERGAHALSLAWVNEARQWFAQLPDAEMRSVTTTSGGEIGKIATGGFAAFSADGVAVVDAQSLFYSFADRTFSERPEFAPPGPGQMRASGLALGLIDEFFRIGSPRAALARGSDSVGITPAVDSRVVVNGIQFAEEYSTELERSQLGGPIDVAVLRTDRTVEWVSRKDECYQDDLKAKGAEGN